MLITRQDIYSAAVTSFEKHSRDRQVIAFKKDLEGNVDRLYSLVKEGKLEEALKFRPLVRVNSNGKVRKINSPSLTTRILEIVWLNKVRPIYDRVNASVGVARNCLPGHGITAKEKASSVLKDLKHLFYDLRGLHLVLVMDQRHCYDHMGVAVYRKGMKHLFAVAGIEQDTELIDFGETVCFVNRHSLPIGTPSSPYIHNIAMLPTDMLMQQCAPYALRYADDCLMAFDSKADLQAAKWRMQNLWWYYYRIRCKRHGIKVVNIDKSGLDFCGYVLHRTPGRRVTDHGKGYTSVRLATVRRAKKATKRNWPCYFGLLRHADTFRLMTKIEQTMKLQDLTAKIRIDRKMDARHIDMLDVTRLSILSVYNYEIRQQANGTDNWIKCLIGTPELDSDGQPTGKELAYEFHGNYQGIIQWIRMLEKNFPNRSFLPIEDARIENQCGYIFVGSSNQIEYIDRGYE